MISIRSNFFYTRPVPFIKEVDLVFNLATRLVDAAEKDSGATHDAFWNTREIGKLEKELHACRAEGGRTASKRAGGKRRWF